MFHRLSVSNLLSIGATVYARVMVSLEPQRKYRAFTKILGERKIIVSVSSGQSLSNRMKRLCGRGRDYLLGNPVALDSSSATMKID